MVASAGSVFDFPAQSMPAWIEDAEGTIFRGVAESVTAEGARIRLPVDPGLEEGTPVALRLSLDPDRPTIAAMARVVWARSEGGETECGLEWTETPALLEAWLASRR